MVCILLERTQQGLVKITFCVADGAFVPEWKEHNREEKITFIIIKGN